MADENNDVIICRCREVAKSEILQAIGEGAKSMDGVKKRTCAGMGLCQGKTCQRLVERILADELGVSPGDIPPASYRVPVRPIKVSIITGGNSAGGTA